jgi:hypothetical protein
MRKGSVACMEGFFLSALSGICGAFGGSMCVESCTTLTGCSSFSRISGQLKSLRCGMNPVTAFNTGMSKNISLTQ